MTTFRALGSISSGTCQDRVVRVTRARLRRLREPTSHSSVALASEMHPVRASELYQNRDKKSYDQDSIVGQHAPSAEGTGSSKTEVSSRGITTRRMTGVSLAEKSIEQQAEVLSDDVLAQAAEIEAHCATKAVKKVAPKRRPRRTAAAVWTDGALCLQAVELSRPAPISEKAKQFRHENLYGGRIRRMSVGAFLGLQKKKAVRRNMKAIVKHN